MLELSIKEADKLQKVAHALASEVRLKIINILNSRSANINQLAKDLEIPISTAASHIKVLEESGLIVTELQSASRGAMKVCTRNFDDIHINLNNFNDFKKDIKRFESEMPIGQYVNFEVAPTCGMADQYGIINPEDEPVHFYSPDRSKAQLIWTRKGFFEYKFPLVIPQGATIEEIQISTEICSEAPNYDSNWPSDITVWLNGVDIGTWTSPGDFGDRPGILTPQYWRETTNTQYGTLKTWKVTNESTWIDEFLLSAVTIQDLEIPKHNFLSFKLGIKDDATHKGGINLFGKEFGDYPQDIKLRVSFY